MGARARGTKGKLSCVWGGRAPGAPRWAPWVPRPKIKIMHLIFFEILHFSMFFSSKIGSGPSRVAPWTPWIDIKIQKKNSIFFFLVTFSYIFS